MHAKTLSTPSTKSMRIRTRLPLIAHCRHANKPRPKQLARKTMGHISRRTARLHLICGLNSDIPDYSVALGPSIPAAGLPAAIMLSVGGQRTAHTKRIADRNPPGECNKTGRYQRPTLEMPSMAHVRHVHVREWAVVVCQWEPSCGRW